MEEKRLIVMFRLPFQGHLNPMIKLAGIFHHRGFFVTILHTSFNYPPDQSRYPNFTFKTIHYDKEGQVRDPLSQKEVSSIDLVGFIRQLRESYAEPFRVSLAEEVRGGGGGETMCCLVSDVVWGKKTEVAAEEVGVRRMVLCTSGAASFCAFAAYPLLGEKGYLPIHDSRLDEKVKELPPLKVKDLPVMETNEPEELYKIVNEMVKGAKSSLGIIWNTFQDLEELSLLDLTAKFQVQNFPIGPFHKHVDNLVITRNNKEEDITLDWLNKQEPKSVVYVSFGSLADIEEKEFLEIANGLSSIEKPFLWVVKPGFVRGTEWTESLPCGFVGCSKGKIVKWVNQLEVLAHPAVGVFWTHCGWNSTLESVCEGVPMICTPCFTDQRVNARYIVDVWKVGMMLERRKIGKEEIVKVIRSVMVEEEGERLREMCLKWKEKANVCLTKDGSSSKYLEKLVSHVLSFESYDFAS
ncbi:unnamed protein product [Cochlearia groenlandica]